MNRIPGLDLDPDAVKGFLDHEEGMRLHALTSEALQLGPCLEVGSYCGKSTLYLGAACQEHHGLVYTVDHHRGSEEHQPGEAYHDSDLFDATRIHDDIAILAASIAE